MRKDKESERGRFLSGMPPGLKVVDCRICGDPLQVDAGWLRSGRPFLPIVAGRKAGFSYCDGCWILASMGNEGAKR